MSYASPPANWYTDPDGSGGLRYWDGDSWTGFRAPPLAPPGPRRGTSWGTPPWKGAQLGRPASGPGALADPGRRLCARLLDLLLLLPVLALVTTVTLRIAAPHFGPIFPTFSDRPDTQPPFPGIFWVYLTILACLFVTGLVAFAYETVAVAKYGRTFGMAWLHIRPVGIDGGALGWGRAFGRAAIFLLAGCLGWIGLLDPLWCLWDDLRQCIHDKVADSVVINDMHPGADLDGGGGEAPGNAIA